MVVVVGRDLDVQVTVGMVVVEVRMTDVAVVDVVLVDVVVVDVVVVDVVAGGTRKVTMTVMHHRCRERGQT